MQTSGILSFNNEWYVKQWQIIAESTNFKIDPQTCEVKTLQRGWFQWKAATDSTPIETKFFALMQLQTATKSKVEELKVVILRSSDHKEKEVALTVLNNLQRQINESEKKLLNELNNANEVSKELKDTFKEKFADLTLALANTLETATKNIRAKPFDKESSIVSRASLILAQHLPITRPFLVYTSENESVEIAKSLFRGENINITKIKLDPNDPIEVPNQYAVDIHRISEIKINGELIERAENNHDKLQIYKNLISKLGNETAAWRISILLTQAQSASFIEKGLKIYNPDAKSVNGNPPFYNVIVKTSIYSHLIDIKDGVVKISTKVALHPSDPSIRQDYTLIKREFIIPLNELRDPESTLSGMKSIDYTSSFVTEEHVKEFYDLF